MNWGCWVNGAMVERADFSLEINNLDIPVVGKNGLKIPLMGVSGGGKSTLLNLLSCMEWPKEGKVLWKFPDKKEFSWGKKGPSSSEANLLRRKYFGFAFQNSTLLPHLDILDNLSYPLQLQKRCSGKETRKTVSEKLKKVLRREEYEELNNILKKFPSQLSGGQRQRVSMVQAMIHDPNVLFADEPTGSLDKTTRKQVMDLLIKWVKDGNGNRLLFWVTHHEDDPKDNDVDIRLCIYTDAKEGKKLSGNGWEKMKLNGHHRDRRKQDGYSWVKL